MAITNLSDAKNFVQSDIGKNLPLINDYYAAAVDASKHGYSKRRYQEALSFINQAATNTAEYAKNALKQSAAKYVQYYNEPGFGELGKKEAARYQTELQKGVNYLMQNKVNATEINQILKDATAQGIQWIQSDSAKRASSSWYDKVFNVANNLMVGGLTAGLGLTAIQASALNSALAIARGANPQDVLRAAIGGMAANQVPDFLKSVGAVSDNPALQAAVTNASRQAVNAAALKQDVKTAALAGLAGGAVAGGTALATDNAAISKAAGEYAQAISAGKTQTEALTSALSGFVAGEQASARQKVLDEANRQQTSTQTAEVPIEERSIGAVGETSSGNVATTGTSQDISTSAKTVPDSYSSLSLLQRTLYPKTYTTLFGPSVQTSPSTITSQQQTSPTQTTITPGSQALAQALRIGDVGAPIFGGDKEEGRRSGWNIESLRYTGNSEA